MIEAQSLTMQYGSVCALTKASFSVSKGEVVGLLGPNGAGKSTTMKILTTYLVPSAGTALVGGKSILDEPIAVRRMIGYLPEVLPLYGKMEVLEYLSFVGRSRGLAGDMLKTRLGWVTDQCGLRPMLRRPVCELSKGYRQRTALAQSLIHDPEVVILDEPTSGLDPHQILEVRKLIRCLAVSKTVILSTHILQEAEAVADRIIIINQGEIVGQGTLSQLREQARKASRVRCALRGSKKEIEHGLDRIGEIRLRTLIEEKKGVCRYELFGVDESSIVSRLGMLALKEGWQVHELAALPFTLEETFLALTEQHGKGRAS